KTATMEFYIDRRSRNLWLCSVKSCDSLDACRVPSQTRRGAVAIGSGSVLTVPGTRKIDGGRIIFAFVRIGSFHGYRDRATLSADKVIIGIAVSRVMSLRHLCRLVRFAVSAPGYACRSVRLARKYRHSFLAGVLESQHKAITRFAQ